MKLLSNTLLAILFVAIIASVTGSAINTPSRVPAHVVRQLQDTVRQRGSCNANICFAIDGSNSISQTAFQSQLEFVILVTAIVSEDPNAKFAAVQYGENISPISSLTDQSNDLLLALSAPNIQVGGDGTFLIGALNFCMSELSNSRNELTKIIVLGDGRGNTGRTAVTQTDLFRSTFGGTVCTVASGSPNNAELLRLAGGNSNLVFELDEFFDTVDTIDLLLEEVCGTQ